MYSDIRYMSRLSGSRGDVRILNFDNRAVRLKVRRHVFGGMATTTAEEPELKHWLGILLVILITAGVGALIPTILFFL